MLGSRRVLLTPSKKSWSHKGKQTQQQQQKMKKLSKESELCVRRITHGAKESQHPALCKVWEGIFFTHCPQGPTHKKMWFSPPHVVPQAPTKHLIHSLKHQ
jgi:hypothetical protein